MNLRFLQTEVTLQPEHPRRRRRGPARRPNPVTTNNSVTNVVSEEHIDHIGQDNFSNGEGTVVATTSAQIDPNPTQTAQTESSPERDLNVSDANYQPNYYYNQQIARQPQSEIRRGSRVRKETQRYQAGV